MTVAQKKREVSLLVKNPKERVALLKPKKSLASKPMKPHWMQRKPSNPKATVVIGTLFSGIGAIEHAFQRLGIKHKIAFAGDIDPFVKKSYLANHLLDENAWHDDVTEFDATRFKNKIDILVGGSPCQSFSMVGKRGGLEDTRGTLFFDFARIVNECRPRVFIFENVRGLLSHDSGQTWRTIQDVFMSLGYDINTKTMNSKDYGIPQHRERIFVVGFRKKNSNFAFPVQSILSTQCRIFLKILQTLSTILVLKV